MSERKIIARRAALELEGQRRRQPRHRHARRRRRRRRAKRTIIDLMTLTAEPGVIGGIPAGGLEFRRGHQHRRRSSTSPTSSTSTTAAASTSPSSASPRPTATAISTCRKFGPRLAGAGGFINISQNAKKVVFVGTFTAGELAGRGRRTARLRIVQRRHVAQVRRRGRAPHIRGRLRAEARPARALRHRALRVPADSRRPGADRDRARHRHRARHPRPDGLPADHRESSPHGPAAIFAPDAMGLRERMLAMPFAAALQLRSGVATCCSSTSEQLAITADADIARIRAEVERQSVRSDAACSPSSTTPAARSRPP